MNTQSRCCLLMLAVAVPALSETLPPVVAKARAQAVADCRPGKAVFRLGYIQTADFNGDGKPDYLVDDGKLECEKQGPEMPSQPSCGTHGCSIEVYLSTGAGYRDAGLALLGFNPTIERGAGKLATLVITDHRDSKGRFRWQGDAFQQIKD